MPRPRCPHRPVGLLMAAALGACGGGGSDSLTSTLTDSQALGYAADATTVPGTAANGLDSASATLEALLAASASGQTSAGAAATALALRGPSADLPPVSLPCPGGGRLSWTVSGGTLAQQLNGRLDAGERYALVFDHCTGAVPGEALDGAAVLTVTAWRDTASDLTLQASALRLTTEAGQFMLDGSARQQRSRSGTAEGGQASLNHLSSPQLSLSSAHDGRSASYGLQALDWSVARTVDRNGAVIASSHQGSVTLVASATRRPTATLQVSTQGSMTLGSDGLASTGSCSLRTGQDTLTIGYGPRTVTISLDQGNDGGIDRRWTLPRADFLAEAG